MEIKITHRFKDYFYLVLEDSNGNPVHQLISLKELMELKARIDMALIQRSRNLLKDPNITEESY